MESADEVRDYYRGLRHCDFRWYALAGASSPRPKLTGFGFGVAARSDDQLCELCRRTGLARPAAYEVRAEGVVGPGSAVTTPLCGAHSGQLNDLMVGDGSGLLIEAATQRACRLLTTASRDLLRDTGPDCSHVLYFEHDNDVDTLRGRSGYVVGLAGTPSHPDHQFALIEVDGVMTNRIHLPQGARARFDRCVAAVHDAMPSSARFRGISSDAGLNDQTRDLMVSVVTDAVGHDSGLLYVFAVACITPEACTRQHVN